MIDCGLAKGLHQYELSSVKVAHRDEATIRQRRTNVVKRATVAGTSVW